MPGVPPELHGDFSHFVSGPARVRHAISGMDAGQLNRRPPGSDWSCRDIVLHLADMEIVRATRMFAIIAEENPVIAAVDEDLYKRRLHYLWRDPELAMALFQHLRFALGEMLEQCDKAAFARTGQHATGGEISLAALVIRGARHSEEHVEQIRQFREALGAPLPR